MPSSQPNQPGGSAASGPAADGSAQAADIVAANTQFAVDLYARLAAAQDANAGGEGNIIFSPASMHMVLSALCAGARGQTARQIESVLHLPASQQGVAAAYANLIYRLRPRVKDGGDAPFELSVANGLWVQQGFAVRKEFLDTAKKGYASQVAQLDFSKSVQAAATINQWVSKATRGKITDLVSPEMFGDLTRLVLANAIYMKAKWADPFERSQTKPQPFHFVDGSTVLARMMTQTERFRYRGNQSVQVLELPYVDKQLSMVIILPRKKDGLAAMEKGLSAEKLNEWLSELRATNVEVSLPTFEFRENLDLEPLLRQMGMIDAFTLSADLSGIGPGPLYVGWAVHKAYVLTDEEGTEAAAATAIGLVAGSMEPPGRPIVFRADHPFIFLIRHSATGHILFMGRVTRPICPEPKAEPTEEDQPCTQPSTAPTK